jgi:hypothetical protein
MSKKFRLLMILTLVVGLFGGLLTASTVSADPTPGDVIEIPRIDVDDTFGTGAWDTRIQIQNVGLAATTVTVEFWGAYSALCPPNQSASLGTVQMWVPIGGIWTLQSAIPAGAESAFVTHDNPLLAELAVTVDRWGPDALGGVEISSSYTGISDPDMVDPGPPYQYYSPYVMHGYRNLDSTITIQNSGAICASIWIYYKEQGNCESMKAQHVEQIGPGESIRIGPGPDADMPFPTPELDPEWLGSAYITSNVPLAIIVDQLSLTGANKGTLLTMRGMPYAIKEAAGITFPWDKRWYADLIYRELSGWQSSIQVQNLTQTSQPTFVTVEFFDQSGDSILFIGDWVCRNGAKTFYLPAITDLGVNFPFGYVGAAEIMSHAQVDYPGGTHSGQPIFAVVDLKKTKTYDATLPGWRHTAFGETQGGAYNAHPYHQKENAYGWAMPHIAKEQLGVTSRIAIRNNANCNKIKGTIFISDETGNVVTQIPVPWLHPKHMKVVDLAYFGQLPRGFVGAATFLVGAPGAAGWDYHAGVEQLCDVDNNGHVDNEPVMPSVVVVNYGFVAELEDPDGPPSTDLGDLTRVYEAIPIFDFEKICWADVFGTVSFYDWDVNSIDPEGHEPLQGADVWDDTGETDVTSYAGGYELQRLASGTRTVTASKCGYFEHSEEVDLECGADTQLDLLLVCQGVLWGQVVDSSTGAVIEGADVSLWVYSPNLDREWNLTATTDANGYWFIVAPIVGESEDEFAPNSYAAWTLTITKDGYDVFTDAYDDDGDGVVDPDDDNYAFADDQGWNGNDCVAVDSEGCDPDDFPAGSDDFCDDPCTELLDEEEFVGSVTPLNSTARVQGRTYCDGLVSEDGDFQWGEEMGGVLVRLYDDGSDTLYDSTTSDATGFYQFLVSEDLIPGFTWGDDLDVVALPADEDADDVDPDETIVVFLDLCPED